MSSTSSNNDNSSTASSPIISPHEFSRLITDPEMTRSVARTFASRPTSTAVLRYYFFLSRSIDRLDQELERHRHERNTIFGHLFEKRSFRMKIQPIIQRYRHLASRTHRGYHPYSHSPSPPDTSLTNNPPSIDNRPTGSDTSPTPIDNNNIDPLSQEGIRGYVSVEVHDQSNDDSLNSYYTAIDETLGQPGSERNPIVISDDEEVQHRRRSLNEIRCAICNEYGHFIVDCTKEYPIDDEEQQCSQGHLLQ